MQKKKKRIWEDISFTKSYWMLLPYLLFFKPVIKILLCYFAFIFSITLRIDDF
jgi:predicted Co/Zn/Cd cation transporter (cation efflux family)